MILIAGWYGRLGNRLRTFAHVIAAAIDAQSSVWNPCFNGTDAELFEHLAVDPLCRFPPKPGRFVGTPGLRRVAGHLAGRLNGYLRSGATLPGVGSIDIGWRGTCDVSSPTFQSELQRTRVTVLSGFRFFHRDIWSHREPLRAFFTPAPRYRDSVTSLMTRARQDCDVLVGIHVRGGSDYQRWRQGAYYYDHATYIDLMDRTSRLFSTERVGYLICGNERLDLGSLTVPFTRGTGATIEDLYALAECDFLMGPPSTFSSWASFYGGVPRYVVKDPGRSLTLDAFIVDRELNFSVADLAPRTGEPK